MTIRCIAMLCLLIALPAQASDDVIATVRAQLEQPNVLRGNFTQAKRIEGFSKPLLSSGDFIVSRERGLLWRTAKPFPGVLKLTRDEIVASQDGAVTFRLSADNEPSVRIINSLMFSLLNGDVAALGKQFTINGSATPQQWSLDLKPKQAAFAKLIRSIAVKGDRHVSEISIDEANGDRTQIRFSDQVSVPATLSADELERFK